MPEKPRPESFAEAMRNAAPYLNLGVGFAATVGLGAIIGWWLDEKLGTQPWLLLGGIFGGLGAAMVHFIRVALPKKRMKENEKNSMRNEPEDER